MVYVTGNPVTLKVTLLTVPSALAVTTAVVLPPSMKFTVSYGFTKSTSLPLPCKFQPAFNTSPTVAALFTFTWLASVPNVGAGCAFVTSAGVPFFVSGRLDFTLVIATGLVPSLSDSLRSPESVFVSLGPSLPPTCTVSNDTLSFVANVNLPPSCVILMFLSASNVTVSPAFTSCLAGSLPNSPSSVLADVAAHAALLIASTTLLTVAILLLSPSFATTVPALSPLSTLLIEPVLTLTPFVSTTKEESAAFTWILFVAVSFSKPLPVFTLYLIFDTLLSVVSTTAVVPSPLIKFTVS